MAHRHTTHESRLVDERPSGAPADEHLLAAFNVSVVLYYTAERPPTWTAHDEAEYVRSNTVVGRHALDGVDVTYFSPSELDGERARVQDPSA